MLILKLLGAAICIVTGGTVFGAFFKKHLVVAVLASLVSIIGAYYLLRDVVADVLRERLEARVELPYQATPGSEITEERPQPSQRTMEEEAFLPAERPADSPEAGLAQTPDGAPASRDVIPPVENRPHVRRVFDALSIEGLSHPEQSPLVFQTAFFNRRLQQELGASSTPIPQIRLQVAFIEPRASRASAPIGTVIGYFLVSFPNLPNCTRQFGGPSYAFPDANTGMMGAVNDAAPDIAHWIERASREEVLTCPD
ncbi:MAG: hypothetical protein ABL883_12610 [Terricaulis sp.]